MRYMIRALHTRIDLWTEPRFKNNPIRVHRATFLIIFIFFLKQAARALKVSERFSGASSRARRITLIKFDGRAETSSGLSRRPAFRERDLSSVSPDVCVCVCPVSANRVRVEARNVQKAAVFLCTHAVLLSSDSENVVI